MPPRRATCGRGGRPRARRGGPAAAPARSPPARPAPGPAAIGCARTAPSPPPRPASAQPPRPESCRSPGGESCPRGAPPTDRGAAGHSAHWGFPGVRSSSCPPIIPEPQRALRVGPEPRAARVCPASYPVISLCVNQTRVFAADRASPFTGCLPVGTGRSPVITRAVTSIGHTETQAMTPPGVPPANQPMQASARPHDTARMTLCALSYLFWRFCPSA
jgi:hypothetical protein